MLLSNSLYQNWNYRHSIYNYDTEDSVRRKFGHETFIRGISSVVRQYVYRDQNLNVLLKNNKVVGVSVFDPNQAYKSQDIRPIVKSTCFDKTGKEITK